MNQQFKGLKFCNIIITTKKQLENAQINLDVEDCRVILKKIKEAFEK